MKIYNRYTKQYYNEDVYKDNALKFAYTNKFGLFILNKFLIGKCFSNLHKLYYCSSLSKHKVNPFIEKYSIDMEQYTENKYSSFNKFFIRQMKEVNYDTNDNALISISDGKMQMYKNNSKQKYFIKGFDYSLNDLFQNEKYSEMFKDSIVIVQRLSVDDYHRYIYPDSGTINDTYQIKGKLHSVGLYSDYNVKVLSENKRVVSILSCDNLGLIAYIEIGALLVGDINNHQVHRFNKGDEKGYFSFGGSTIVLVIKNSFIDFDDDIKDIITKSEVKVKVGERIGTVK